MLQAPSKPLKLEKLSKILFTLTLKSGKNYAWKPLKVAIFCRKRPWKPWNRYEKMARHPVWNFIPSLIFRSLALSYRLGNKRGENVRKLGQNMSGNCQECQEFSTLQKSGHSVIACLSLPFLTYDPFHYSQKSLPLKSMLLSLTKPPFPQLCPDVQIQYTVTILSPLP